MQSIKYHSQYPDKIALEASEIQEVPAGFSLIKINAAALNRRDQWIREGFYPGIKDGVTLGSDGSGVVLQGAEELVGQKVIINPNINWGDDPAAQSSSYTILGMPTDGTLASHVVIPNDRLVRQPAHLTDEEAAALPLAGLTAYRACFTKAALAKGQKVLITGIGGGVAQFALQFAAAQGASAYVTSSSEDKISRAVSTGAIGGFNYKASDWVKRALQAGPFDAIIDGAGGASVQQYIKLVKPGGRIIFYGSTSGEVPPLNLARLFWSQASLIGSTMGNDQEFAEMVDLVSSQEIKPVIDQVYAPKDFIAAFDRFKAHDHYGKIVLTF